MKKRNIDRRYRAWCFILYPESCPDDFYERLNDLHVPVAISPLHDLDFDENKEKKKAHYHVILVFDGKKSYEQIKEITDSLCAPGPQPINCLSSYYRYLCHLDETYKVHYDVNGIILLGGFDPKNYISEQIGVFVSEMVDYVQANNVVEYSEFVEFCREEHLNDWFRILTDYKSQFFRDYINSKKYKGYR